MGKVSHLLKVTDLVLVRVVLRPGPSGCTVHAPDLGQPPDGRMGGASFPHTPGVDRPPRDVPILASLPLPCTGS